MASKPKLGLVPGSPKERRAFGKGLRSRLHRVDQRLWNPKSPHRADPLEVIRAVNARRLAHLIPLKMKRMAASPFGFFRGAAPVMAADLALLPTTGLRVQMCGDAHVRNLGAYASPDGMLVFDLNDFDETMPGPWEWDLKRLAASFVLAGEESGDSFSKCKESVLTLVRAYRESMDQFSRMNILELSRHLTTKSGRSARKDPVQIVLAMAERASPRHLLEKLTVPARHGRRFRNQPPLLSRVPEETARKVVASLKLYRETLGPGARQVLDAHRPMDVAFKVVGTGSVGLRDYVVLCFGNGPSDALFLQVKEAGESCYARYLKDVPRFGHQGERVAEGQHRMQTVSDPLLGWTTIEGRNFLVRQLNDHKAGIVPAELRGAALSRYALVCGEILAKAHARTGDPAAIAGYCGGNTKLDKAIAKFARAYAEQTHRDYDAFVKALRARKVLS